MHDDAAAAAEYSCTLEIVCLDLTQAKRINSFQLKRKMRFSTNNLLYSVLQFQFLKKPLLLVRIEQVIHKMFHYIICV